MVEGENGVKNRRHEFVKFVSAGIEKWKSLKKDFSYDEGITAFLKKAYPVVMLDNYQIDMILAKNLFKKIVCSDSKKPKPEEVPIEKFRQQMIAYLENDLMELAMEIRFPHINMGYIRELKSHVEIKDLNEMSDATIRVVIACRKYRVPPLQASRFNGA